MNQGFPGSPVHKESAHSVGDLGSVPGLGRSPGGGHGNPRQYSCQENPHGQRSLEGHNPWGCKESDMTRQLSTKHYHKAEWWTVCKISLPLTTLLSHPLPHWLWAWPCEFLWPVRHQQTCSKQRLSEIPVPGACPVSALRILSASQAMNQSEPAGREEPTRRRTRTPRWQPLKHLRWDVGHFRHTRELRGDQTASPDYCSHLHDPQNHEPNKTALVLRHYVVGSFVTQQKPTAIIRQYICFYLLLFPLIMDGFWWWRRELSTRGKKKSPAHTDKAVLSIVGIFTSSL